MDIKDAVRSVFGSLQARREHLRSRRPLSESLAALDDISVTSEEAPIFVFAAGWRSGSTMVQRLLMSDGETLIWGEPYDKACLIQHLSDALQPFSEEWPRVRYLRRPERLGELSAQWVANLYPPLEALKAAFLAMLDRLYAQPARELGARRWGLKEVRLGVDHARLLRWLYPRAKFVFVYRNPFDAYASYKAFSSARNWYARWPVEPVFTTAAFGRHWRRLAEDFRLNAEAVDALVIRYEDLVSGAFPLDRLAEHCQVPIDRRIIALRVGGSRREEAGIARLERFLLARATSPVAASLGY